MRLRRLVTSSPFRRTLRLYYVHTFSYDFIFGYAIFPAYFQLQGTSAGMIGVLLAFWAACIMLLEVPSGLLSDVADRRILLTVAPLLKAGCFATWAVAGGSVWLYLAGFFFWSAASTLRSGTKEALLYEHVQANRMQRRYAALIGWDRACHDGATMIGAVIGGFIAYHNLELSLWLSLIPLGVSSLAAFLLSDVRPAAGRVTARYFADAPALLKTTWNDFRAKPDIRYITAYIALGVTFLGTLEDFDQLFYLAINLPVWSFGLIAAVIGAARFVLSVRADRLPHLATLVWLLPLVCGAGFVLAGSGAPKVALAALVLAYIAAAPLHVVAMSRFQHGLSGHSRATTTSVMSICIESFAIVFNLAIAALMYRFSVLTAYVVCGLYLVGFAFWELSRVKSRN